MDRKYQFNGVPEAYDQFRPHYPKELFSDIIHYSNIKEGSRILEIGCGTGQATQGFVDLGYKNLTCVELGNNLADFTAEKYKGEPTIIVHNAAFEDWNCERDAFDVAISATAFHFIDPHIGYPKVHDLLKSDGTMAFFWTVHVQVYDELHNEIRELYKKYALDLDDSIKPGPKEVMQETYHTILGTGLFSDLQMKTYQWEHSYSSEDYVSLLNTHSKHRQIEEKQRHLLLSGIKETIDSHGGYITKPQLVALYLGKK